MKTISISNQDYLNFNNLKEFSNANHDVDKILSNKHNLPNLPNISQSVNEAKNYSNNLRTNTNQQVTNQQVSNQQVSNQQVSNQQVTKQNNLSPSISKLNNVSEPPSITTQMLENHFRKNNNKKNKNNNSNSNNNKLRNCWQSELMAIFPLSVLILLLIFVILLIFVLGFQSK